MKILLINPPYPHGGKRQVYLPTSLCMLASKILASSNNQVRVLDLNLTSEREYSQAVEEADLCCLSIAGLPFMPFAKQFAIDMNTLGKKFCIGGQALEHFPDEQTKRLFPNVILEKDFWGYADVRKEQEVSMLAGLELFTEIDLRGYLSCEMPLFVGDNCVYNCDFCAARKNAIATVRNLKLVSEEVAWLQNKAKEFDIKTLNFYATSLDFFQTRPKEILETLATLNRDSDVKIHVRCLATIQYTELSIRKVQNLAELCKEAGLHTIGLGEDGDESIWFITNKKHNDRTKFFSCLSWGKKNEITFQVLQVSGFPSQSIASNIKGIVRGLIYSLKYNTQIRPYTAKVNTPLQVKTWDWEKAQDFKNEWKAFDYSAVATNVSHPSTRWPKRMLINFCFLTSVYIVPLFSKSERYSSPPVFPEWRFGLIGKFWKWVNSKTGFDI